MIATNYDAVSTGFRIRLESNLSTAYRRELRSGVRAALDQGERRIVIDCSSWFDLDLVLLSALMDCASACDEQGANFEMANLDPGLRARIEALRVADRIGLGS